MDTIAEGQDKPRKLNLPRFLVMGVLLLICIGLEYYFHFILGTHIVYTHLFYFPIVLAAIWWGLKGGLPTSLFLAFLHIVPYLPDIELAVFSRGLLFIFIGSTMGAISDKYKRAENEVHRRKGIEAIFRGSGDGMRTIDTEYKITNQNEEMNRLCGVEKIEAVGKRCSELFHGPLCDTNECVLRQILSGAGRIKIEMEKTLVKGDAIPVSLIATPLEDEEGKVIGVIESFRDITERKEIEKEREKFTKELKRLARIDGLTGIFNRQYLDKKLEDEVKRAERYDRPLSIIMLDADNFKEINDRCGHQVGDKTLKTIAKDIQEIIRTTDFVGRYGGEEFLAVCVETAMDEAMSVAKRIRLAIGQIQVKDKKGSPVKVTVSLGVAQYDGSEDTDHLVARADDALYRAKTEGKNRVYRAEES